jgi:small conductance mechanosensitive channel
MELQGAWREILKSFTLGTLVLKAARVICIAIAFEFIAWWLGRRVEKLVAPYITADAERDPSWRMRRRTTLRQTPKIITRTLCYTVALILVFDVFGVPVLSLAIAVGAVVTLFGAALLPILRDLTQGYMLLAEDAVAVGDVVEINGHRGTVEKLTLRSLWLRDEAGHLHEMSNREVRNIVVLSRRAEPRDGNRPQ